MCASFLQVVLRTVENCNVEVVYNGNDALQVLRQGAVDVVVTDLHMPVLDGFRLIEKIREKTEHAKLPILVISGDGEKGTPERARGLGANSYLAKPYSPAEVRQVVKDLLHEA